MARKKKTVKEIIWIILTLIIALTTILFTVGGNVFLTTTPTQTTSTNQQ